MVKQLFLKDLKPGMVLAQPLVSGKGSIVVEAGTLLTEFVIGTLQDSGYMQSVLPEGTNYDEVTVTVFEVEPHGALTVEDLSHVGAKETEEDHKKSDS
ncbi:MAG: hypothetical protein J6N22_09470, partial [Schwartzia sp.]|nr:hypothetical protein [Schwartzia sp. (in: firmicutes)]